MANSRHVHERSSGTQILRAHSGDAEVTATPKSPAHAAGESHPVTAPWVCAGGAHTQGAVGNAVRCDPGRVPSGQFGGTEAHGEARAVPRFRARLYVDFAVMSARDGTHDGQAEPAALFGGFARTAEKWLENAGHVIRRHAGALILHGQLGMSMVLRAHPHDASARRMLHRVVEQVDDQAM